MQKLISYFFSDFNLKFQARWFKRLLYSLLIIKCIYWLCFYDVLFGANRIFLALPYPLHSVGDLAFLLYAIASPQAAYGFIFATLLLSIVQLIRPRLYFITDVVLWFLVVNLHNKIYASLTGGDYLLNQFLLFNCFFSASFTIKSSWQNQLRVFLHNLAGVAVIIQVCLVYVLSAFLKLANAEWLHGRALEMIAQIKHFSIYAFPAAMHLPASLYLLLTYVVLIYQGTFPLLIWLKPFKKPFLIIGIIMHLYIALVMGLMGFGAIMIISYIFFWPFAEEKLPVA